MASIDSEPEHRIRRWLNQPTVVAEATSLARRRLAYVAAALATIGVGLGVHLGGKGLPVGVRDVAGDALWAMMITWWVSALGPRLARGARAAFALAICYAVEVSQLFHAPALDALRRTTVGHLVLGSGFDPRDLAAYALGVLGALVIERTVAARGRTRHEAKPGVDDAR